MNPDTLHNTCKLCEPWDEAKHTPPHRHRPNHWIFPSATTPGGLYNVRVIRQSLDDEPLTGGTGKPIGISCSCELGRHEGGGWCWHGAAAFAFELEHDGRHKPHHNPVRYEQACKGSLKNQAVILWSQAREAARQQNAARNRTMIRALHRIVEAWNITLPTGIEMRISCVDCLGVQFPEVHAHWSDARAAHQQGDTDAEPEIEEATEDEIEAAWQQLMSPYQRDLRAQAQSWERNGHGDHKEAW